ncbi:MAG: hypothetical protein JWM10_4940 [Myxococcaceae bacterium]|nr:hypothetical protein [Myxococcaceae bacterium]
MDGQGGPAAIDEAFWETRGRAVYGVADADPMLDVLSQRAAEAAVLRRLGAGLRAVPDAHRDAAIAAAARGFFAAHRALGRAAERIDPPTSEAPSTCPVETLLADRRSDGARGVPRPPVPPRARKFRAGGELNVVTFTLSTQPAIARGLTGGTARLLAGEDAIAAVSRRIARETRCVVEGVAVDRQEPVVGASGCLWHCRFTLRPAARRNAANAPAPAVLAVVVRDYRAAPAAP